jgi:hypothetical protein
MGQKFIITESERERIKSLYEQSTPSQPIQPQIQGTFEYGAQGLTPYVIINVNGVSAQDLYNKTLNWVKTNWENPDKVIKMTMPNERIRVGGYQTGLMVVRKIPMGVGYTIEIAFKDNKLRFDVVSILSAPDGVPTGYNYREIPNFKGDEKLMKNFGNTASNIELYFNNLVKGLSNFISGAGTSAKDDW